MLEGDFELGNLAAEIDAASADAQRFRRMDFWRPYRRQAEFLAAGAVHRERLLMAGNRVGKTETGAFEAAVHVTGLYPSWWIGRRFTKPVSMWCCGQTAQAVRDIVQAKLCGPPGVVSEWGTGMIPKGAIIDKSTGRGIEDAIDTLQVRHKSGGVSYIQFKSYEQGRAKFQGVGLDAIWFDEEPPLDLYAEGLTRIGERDGISWMTFTPLMGRSGVVLRFIDEPSPTRIVIGMTIEDAEHISESQRAKIISGYLPHEKEARERGVPVLGSGRVFTSSEESISEAPLSYIPLHWTKLWGIDPGIGHPFGAVLMIWDRDNDVIHVHHTIRMVDALPLQHWYAMKQIGADVPIAWPKDAGDREKSTGEPLAAQYRKHGARMLAEHAHWPDGGVSTEAGILEMDERMKTGRFKVSAQLADWFEEYRYYHRKDGQIVKLKDDLMSATRIAAMMKRYGKPVPLGPHQSPRGSNGGLAKGIDFDLFP
jgi:phage terminase large subunit-like protein